MPTQNAPDWKNRFFTIWTTQAVSLLGSAIVRFGIIWWLAIETGSTGVLAFSTLVTMIPPVVLGPFVGALVDRWKRRRILIWSDTVIGIATLALAFLYIGGSQKIWQIYVLLFIRAIGDAFHSPAMSASTPLMVPEKHLTRIAGANQTLLGMIRIAAPAAGAALVLTSPMWVILFIDVSTAVVAIAPLIFIDVPQPNNVKWGYALDSGTRYI